MSKWDDEDGQNQGGGVNMPEILARLPDAQRGEIIRIMQDVIRKEKTHRDDWQNRGLAGEPESAILSERKTRLESRLNKRLGVRTIDLSSGNN